MRYICVIFYFILAIDFQCAKKIYKRNVLDTYHTDNTIKRFPRKTRDVCDLDRPPTPNFRRPERRVSETKCLEYIWDKIIRVRLNNNECDKSSRDKELYSAISGENALPEEFSHMGGIGWRTLQETWEFICGCTLISENYIVTAAHCTKQRRNKNLVDYLPEVVRFGDAILIDIYINGTRPNDYKILSIIRHPMYKVHTKHYDIALMKIETVKRFTNYLQPACLWSDFDTSQLRTSAMSVSWRVIETATNTTSHLLQFTEEANIIDTEQCSNLLRPYCNRNGCKVQEHQLCAGKWEYLGGKEWHCVLKGYCGKLTLHISPQEYGGKWRPERDIGGPLQAKIPLNYTVDGSLHYIIGIGSFGYMKSSFPTVYTRISSFMDWIESIVWSDN